MTIGSVVNNPVLKEHQVWLIPGPSDDYADGGDSYRRIIAIKGNWVTYCTGGNEPMYVPIPIFKKFLTDNGARLVYP